MKFIYHWTFPSVWAVFWGYWFISARRVKKTKKAEPRLERTGYLTILGLAFALMALPVFHTGFLGRLVWPQTNVTFFTGVGIFLAGLAFAVWARVHLGQYWSGTVTLKEGHRLIRTGPYALVRHPIYTGVLLGVVGTAVALAEVRGVIAFLILFVLHLFKSRREERWLEGELGEEYRQYRKEVPALVPFVM